jgi:hypothetical protein
VPPIIRDPKDEIRQFLLRWPYELQPDEAIMAASTAIEEGGKWHVRLPARFVRINISITTFSEAESL